MIRPTQQLAKQNQYFYKLQSLWILIENIKQQTLSFMVNVRTIWSINIEPRWSFLIQNLLNSGSAFMT